MKYKIALLCLITSTAMAADHDTPIIINNLSTATISIQITCAATDGNGGLTEIDFLMPPVSHWQGQLNQVTVLCNSEGNQYSDGGGGQTMEVTYYGDDSNLFGFQSNYWPEPRSYGLSWFNAGWALSLAWFGSFGLVNRIVKKTVDHSPGL